MAAGRWVGRGDKEGGDGAAVDAMRELVNSVSMRGVVVIGEGEKDNAPMLYNGEEVGNGDGPECDFAVDPIDGTTLMAKGMPNAISVLAVAERGAMFDPSAVFYMNKIAVGPDAVDAIDITAPIGENIRRVAKAKSVSVSDLTVCILDRPRHEPADRRRPRGGRPDPADLRRRRRGRHLGVPARTPAPTCWPASAARRRASSPPPPSAAWAAPSRASWRPRTTTNARRPSTRGYDLDQVLLTEDLVSGENVFFCATGVTDGDLLKGVHYYGGGCTTQSIVMRSQVGHRPDDRGLPPAVQAQRILRDRFHRRQQRRLPAAVTNH